MTMARPRGFTLIEVLVCVALVSITLVAALNGVAAVRMTQVQFRDDARGQLAAQELLAEVLANAYSDPDQAPSFGPESGETVPQVRSNYDDVDDFNGWDSSPPRLPDGTIRTDLAGWRERIEVMRVDPDNPATSVGTDAGLRRVTVSLTRPGLQVQLVGFVHGPIPELGAPGGGGGIKIIISL